MKMVLSFGDRSKIATSKNELFNIVQHGAIWNSALSIEQAGAKAKARAKEVFDSDIHTLSVGIEGGFLAKTYGTYFHVAIVIYNGRDEDTWFGFCHPSHAKNQLCNLLAQF